jgi:hypothetical protein
MREIPEREEREREPAPSREQPVTTRRAGAMVFLRLGHRRPFIRAPILPSGRFRAPVDNFSTRCGRLARMLG